MVDVVYVSDFFVEDVNGGAEQNDAVLLSLLKQDDRVTDVSKIYSSSLTLNTLKENEDSLFIISNFIKLPFTVKKKLEESHTYIIYEHDHKYLLTRDPTPYSDSDFVAPADELNNVSFYENALKVLCQSKFHADIARKNLPNANVVELNGNLWTHHTLDYIESICETPKTKNIAILDSPIPHKNTKGCQKYCMSKNQEYTLLGNMSHHDFLEALAEHEFFMFMPLTCETLSRILVEAKMLNCKIVSSENVGVLHEKWFWEVNSGVELISYVRDMHTNILNIVLDRVNNPTN